MSPRVSVVLPTRDRLEKLRRALAAVHGQTFRDFEVWIVDDGSKDGTAQYLRNGRLREDYPGIPAVRVLFNDRCVGAAAARNQAMDRARGEIIAFLDDDDVWLPDYLRRQVATLDRHPEASASYTAHTEVDPGGRHREPDLQPLFRYDSALIQLVTESFLHTLSVFVCRREVVDRVGPFDDGLHIVHDLEWYARLLMSGGTILPVTGGALVRRETPGGAGHQAPRVVRGRAERAGTSVQGEPGVCLPGWACARSPRAGLRPARHGPQGLCLCGPKASRGIRAGPGTMRTGHPSSHLSQPPILRPVPSRPGPRQGQGAAVSHVLEQAMSHARIGTAAPLPHYLPAASRKLTRRGILWLGLTCNLRCHFCYFLDRIEDPAYPEHAFMSLEKAKAICRTLVDTYGNKSIDIQGGEPTVYPSIYQLVEYCARIGLSPTIYLGDPRAPGAIADRLPDARLVAILRHPAERAFSAFLHLLRDNYEPLSSFRGGSRCGTAADR